MDVRGAGDHRALLRPDAADTDTRTELPTAATPSPQARPDADADPDADPDPISEPFADRPRAGGRLLVGDGWDHTRRTRRGAAGENTATGASSWPVR